VVYATSLRALREGEYVLDANRAQSDDSEMTLQVGLVGTDGVVMAGDLCGGTDELGVRQTSLSSKFRRAGDDLFAYSGGALAYLITNSCIDAFNKGIREFETVVKGAFEKLARDSSIHAPNIGGSILAIVDGTLIRANLTGFGPIFDIGVRDRIAVGDVRNAAIFFCQRYYRAGMETADLLPLAVAVICIGGKLNPNSVQGLEVAIYKHGVGLSILEPPKLAALSTWADGIDITIGQSLTRRLGI
jgi:hypothetical protein